jgi:hypothetical protein
MGNTEFLLPEGVMVPERGLPPLLEIDLLKQLPVNETSERH